MSVNCLSGKRVTLMNQAQTHKEVDQKILKLESQTVELRIICKFLPGKLVQAQIIKKVGHQ